VKTVEQTNEPTLTHWKRRRSHDKWKIEDADYVENKNTQIDQLFDELDRVQELNEGKHKESLKRKRTENVDIKACKRDATKVPVPPTPRVVTASGDQKGNNAYAPHRPMLMSFH